MIQRWLGRLYPLALALYPLVVYWGLSAGVSGSWFLFLALPLLVKLMVRQSWQRGWSLLLPLGLLALLLLALASQRDHLVLYWPVLINLNLLLTFGWTHFTPQPLVERFALMQVSHLSPAERAYCRGLNLVWCSFFALNAGLAGALAWWGDLVWWSLYNGLISYLLMALIFTLEILVRSWRFRRYEGFFLDPLLKRLFPPLPPQDPP